MSTNTAFGNGLFCCYTLNHVNGYLWFGTDNVSDPDV